MIPLVARTVEEIPLALIDDPEIAMRDTFDDEQFQELVDDIRANGVQVAIIVERRGDRFRVAAGHRRVTACRALKAATVPCDIREPGLLDAEAIKVLENDVRENVNAAEAALYLARLYVERCDSDVDRVCALVRRSRKYVEDRLVLLHGDPEVFAALKAKRIRIGVALELNAITDRGYRLLHLDNALRHGLTTDAARQARRDANRAVEMGARGADTSALPVPDFSAPAEARNVCTVCLGSDHPERMRWVPVHEHCQLAVLEKLLAPFRAAQGDDADA